MKSSILRLALPAAMIALPWALPPLMALAAAAARSQWPRLTHTP